MRPHLRTVLGFAAIVASSCATESRPPEPANVYRYVGRVQNDAQGADQPIICLGKWIEQGCDDSALALEGVTWADIPWRSVPGFEHWSPIALVSLTGAVQRDGSLAVTSVGEAPEGSSPRRLHCVELTGRSTVADHATQGGIDRLLRSEEAWQEGQLTLVASLTNAIPGVEALETGGFSVLVAIVTPRGQRWIEEHLGGPIRACAVYEPVQAQDGVDG